MMNLYYKPDWTTRPATAALYVLFVMTLMAGFGKLFVYDLLLKLEETEEQMSRVQRECGVCEERLENYDEILRQYRMYSAAEEEEGHTDRMEILELLDEKVRPSASISSVSVTKGLVNVRFSGVTLGETAEIVRKLNTSPLVAGTSVSTAVAEDKSTGPAEKKVRKKAPGKKRNITAGAAANEGKSNGQKTEGAAADEGKNIGKKTKGAAANEDKSIGRKTEGTFVTADIQISLQNENGEENKKYETTDRP